MILDKKQATAFAMMIDQLLFAGGSHVEIEIKKEGQTINASFSADSNFVQLAAQSKGAPVKRSSYFSPADFRKAYDLK